jgi:hypothetical protein
MLGFSALISLVGSPLAGLVAKILSVLLIGVVVVLGFRLAAADGRLALAKSQAALAAAQRDRALADLAVSRSNVASLGQALAAQNDSLREGKAAADKRLLDAQHAIDKAQADAGAREVRIRALLADAPQPGETRCDSANRLINEALKVQKS